jgi:hypothetical protein
MNSKITIIEPIRESKSQSIFSGKDYISGENARN